jgi:hypothetical protein
MRPEMGAEAADVTADLRGHRRVLCTALAGALAFLAACGNSSTSSTPTATPTAKAKPSLTPKDTPMATAVPQTPTPIPPGQYAAPVIVQVENSEPARPQSGLNSAALVYEYETEGGISRFSAMFTKPPATQVGPVRSARLVTIQLLEIYHAVLMYSGASVYVDQSLGVAGVPHYNETSAQGALFRVGSRFAPHNLYTDAAHINGLMARVAPAPAPLQLWGRTDPVNITGGTPLNSFTVPISGYERPVFTYHPEVAGYTRSEPTTGAFGDAGSGTPVLPGTVIVLTVPIAIAPEVEDVSGTHGLDHTVKGTGYGQVMSGGRYFQVTYTQLDSGVPLLLTSDGLPAPIAPGLVWVCLVHLGQPAFAS